MLRPEHSDRTHVAFDLHRVVANAKLNLPATLAHRLGLDELPTHYIDLEDARVGPILATSCWR